MNAVIEDEQIDLTDIPEWSETQVAHAEIGKNARPRKTQKPARLDTDVIRWFRKHYPDYEAAMNDALRAFMDAHSDDDAPDQRKTV